jgi:O-succinylbenzoate synthase
VHPARLLEPWPAIDAVELVRVRIPLVRPHVYATGEERARDVVLVRAVTADGAEGWGECSSLSTPGYVGQTTDASWATLADDLAPRWLCGELRDESTILVPTMAGAALEEAALDLVLRSREVTLADRLAEDLGPRRASVQWCAVVSTGDIDAVIHEVGAALGMGAAQVKVKIAPGSDVEVLRDVRRVYPDAAIAADANGSYGSGDEVPLALFDVGLAYLEQPLPARDIVGSAQLVGRGTPIALDESLAEPGALDQIAAATAPLVLSVKVARCGGVAAAADMLARARDLGCRTFVGGMLETAVGRAIALAVASQAPSTLPCDAGPTSRYFAADVGPAFEPDDQGSLHPPTGAGIGAVPSDHGLESYTVDRLMLAS